MSNQFQTTVYLQVVDGDDAELEVTIDYKVTKGYLPSYMDPGCPDEVEIQKVVDTKTGEDVGPYLTRQIEGQQLYNNILADWHEAEIAAADAHADYLYELRREETTDRRSAA